MGPGASIELDRVRVFREGGVASRPVLDGVTLSLDPGERVFLLGPNGAGKTSLLLALVGATRFEGHIRVGGTELSASSLDGIRSVTGFVFAEPGDQFFLDEVTEEVAFGPRQRGLPEAIVTERVRSALAAMKLEGHVGRRPLELSLGEQRRLAMATALATEPSILLLDEPTAALDPRARRAVLDAVSALAATVIVATHDLDAALGLGGRAVLLQDGRVVADGPGAELLLDERVLSLAGLELPLSVRRT